MKKRATLGTADVFHRVKVVDAGFYPSNLTGRQVAEQWVRDHWQGEREIEGWRNNLFSLVCGVSAYEVADEAEGIAIYRLDRKESCKPVSTEE